MASRADFLTEIIKKKEFYSDIPTNFDSVPGTESLTRLTNEDALKSSVKNVILTQFGERFFQPTFGSSIRKLLFENSENFLKEDLRGEIIRTVNQNEPRASISNLDIIVDPENYLIKVYIVFFGINRNEPVVLDFILRRVR